MLTRKQHDLLHFIHDRLSAAGVPPSFDEMKDALGLKSKSGIHRLITGLEERGFIRRLPHRARALEVVRLPEDMAGEAVGPRIGAALSGLRAAAASAAEAMAPVPMLGRIAAGTPIEALSDPSTFADVPSSMLTRGEHYALEVDGDSMIEAGIHDGDTVIIERCDTADDGAIVVALVDDAEVTLKRLRRRGQMVELEPANARYETQRYGSDRVVVQGRLIGLLRQY